MIYPRKFGGITSTGSRGIMSIRIYHLNPHVNLKWSQGHQNVISLKLGMIRDKSIVLVVVIVKAAVRMKYISIYSPTSVARTPLGP